MRLASQETRTVSRKTRLFSRETRREVVTYIWAVLYRTAAGKQQITIFGSRSETQNFAVLSLNNHWCHALDNYNKQVSFKTCWGNGESSIKRRIFLNANTAWHDDMAPLFWDCVIFSSNTENGFAKTALFVSKVSVASSHTSLENLLDWTADIFFAAAHGKLQPFDSDVATHCLSRTSVYHFFLLLPSSLQSQAFEKNPLVHPFNLTVRKKRKSI